MRERHGKGVVGCDQLVAFGGWIAQADSWPRLAVVSALCAHIIPAPTPWSRVAVVAGVMLVICGPRSKILQGRCESRNTRRPLEQVAEIRTINNEIRTVNNHVGYCGSRRSRKPIGLDR